MSELQPHERALGKHIIAHCREAPAECIEDHTPSEVELKWHGWTIESVDGDDTTIEVHATQTGTETQKVRSATYNPPGKAHPAEYKNYEGTVHAVARVDWSENPLAGDTTLHIEYEGGAPPDEPSYERYDEL